MRSEAWSMHMRSVTAVQRDSVAALNIIEACESVGKVSQSDRSKQLKRLWRIIKSEAGKRRNEIRLVMPPSAFLQRYVERAFDVIVRLLAIGGGDESGRESQDSGCRRRMSARC